MKTSPAVLWGWLLCASSRYLIKDSWGKNKHFAKRCLSNQALQGVGYQSTATACPEGNRHLMSPHLSQRPHPPGEAGSLQGTEALLFILSSSLFCLLCTVYPRWEGGSGSWWRRKMGDVIADAWSCEEEASGILSVWFTGPGCPVFLCH